jgi:hypothetical protein
LLVHELRLAALFRQKGAALKNSAVTEIDLPTDYQDHVLAADIEEVAALAIRGLEPIGHRFDPDKAVTRANFAVIIEDILMRITRERELPTRFIGAKSPFVDVDTSHYAFNAIVTCTTRGMMRADINGCFKGAQAVPGADALLILRHLKDAANDMRF